MEATLRVTNNYPIERKVTIISPNELKKFYQNILKQPNLIFYNSNIYPTKSDDIVNICWYRSIKPLTILDRTDKKQNTYYGSMFLEQLLRRTPLMKYIRGSMGT